MCIASNIESQFKESVSCKHCWKPKGLHAHTEKPMIDYQNRENTDNKINHDQTDTTTRQLQRQRALWKSGAAPTGALFDARALVLIYGSRIFPN